MKAFLKHFAGFLKQVASALAKIFTPKSSDTGFWCELRHTGEFHVAEHRQFLAMQAARYGMFYRGPF